VCRRCSERLGQEEEEVVEGGVLAVPLCADCKGLRMMSSMRPIIRYHQVAEKYRDFLSFKFVLPNMHTSCSTR
jgi:hypothetical protein